MSKQASTDNPNSLPALTPLQRQVLHDKATEPPFANAYWHHQEDGIYVDAETGQPLFTSLDKYDSKTGWPSFSKPVDDHTVSLLSDRQLSQLRTEVVAAKSGNHLGHVFDDGPGPQGKRYCINSAALHFIPLADMRAKGYQAYLFAFANKQHWQVATVAGGCFWGMENLFRQQPGVLATQVGYAGGTEANPNYQLVSSRTTNYAEAVQILFDPAVTNYSNLLHYFFRIHDPTQQNAQGHDVGPQYRSVIFVADANQDKIAQTVLAAVNTVKFWPTTAVTEIIPLDHFWRAEEEHQNYLVKHPHGYSCHYERSFAF